MSELVQRREPRQPGELNSLLLIEGIIGGSIVLLVVSLVDLYGIFNIPNEGIVQGIVASIVLICARRVRPDQSVLVAVETSMKPLPDCLRQLSAVWKCHLSLSQFRCVDWEKAHSLNNREK
jgi:hypothetical protein